MKSLQFKLALLGFMMFIAFSGYGQRHIKISGSLIDSVTREPIPFATALLLSQETKAYVKAIPTDTNGNFVFEHVPIGVFTLKATYIGYQDIVKENILVAASTGDVDLGKLLIAASNSRLLQEVVIAAKKEALQNIDGKKIFSVNQSLVSKGGTAADLLQNVPTLQIENDGKVSLRGATGVKVLIDGKPSVIANGDVTRILQSIPASSIESIEVIANPSAKYDANGEGIINIILKKNNKPGTDGSVAIGGGTHSNYNSDASLSYKNGKINLFGSYSLKDGDTYSNGIQYLTFLNPTDSVKFSTETFPSLTRNKIQFVKAGLEYSFTPKGILGISGSASSRKANRDEALGFTNFDAAGKLIQSYNRYNTINNNGNSYEVDLDYRQHFKKAKEELVFNFSYSHGTFNDDQEYKTTFNSINEIKAPADDRPLTSDIRSGNTIYNIQADFILPLGKSGQFSAGYRSQFAAGSKKQYAYTLLAAGQSPLHAFTSFFNSNNQVHAVYLEYKDEVEDFSYQFGLRGEDSHLNAVLMSYDVSNLLFATPIKIPVKGFYPNVQLTQKFANKGELQFTFTRRLSKPTGREINPTTDFSDPANYYRGNAGLTPETINNLELDYNQRWQSGFFTSGIYYNRVNNVIQHIQTRPVNNETTTTPENLKRKTTVGLELIGHFDFVKVWDITANANIFKRSNDAAPQFGIVANKGISWNANITSNVTLQKLSFQVHADYRAAYMEVQDKNRAAFGLDAAAKYGFAKKRASLSLNVNDIFNTRKGAFLRSSDYLLLDWERRTVSSRATLTLAYHLGSGALKHP